MRTVGRVHVRRYGHGRDPAPADAAVVG